MAAGRVPCKMADISSEASTPTSRVTTAAYVVLERSGTPWSGSSDSMSRAPKGPPSSEKRTVTGYLTR